MNLKLLASSAALLLCASASFAQESPPIPLVLSPTGPNTLAATFERTVTGLFVDTFTFTPASFSGDVSVSLKTVEGPVNFFSALLNGEGFSFLPENGMATFDFQSRVSADQLLKLQVFGFAGDAGKLTDMTATYGGTITARAVAAIPEPETFALMLAGLALIGALHRRSPGHKTTAN